MLSVIILCGQASPETVVRTLAPLVQASVQGLVRDVVLAGPAGSDLSMIADHAGCAFVEAETEAEALRRAIAAARGGNLMIFHAGHIPEAGFLEELEDLLAVGLSAARGGHLLRAAPESFLQRLVPRLAPAVGLIAARELCMAEEIASFRHLRARARARNALRRRMRRIL
jgi:hypothetical protein